MDKSVESIDNVNFFLNSDTSAWIAKQFGDDEPVLKLNPDETFSFDLIEQPFHIILKGEDDGSVLYLFIRNQFGVYAEESADITLTFATDGAEPVMKSNGNLAGDPESSAKHFARVGIELRRRFMESKQKLVLDDYDPDREGVLVTLCGEALLYERVKGKNRPSMKCYGLMNQSGMMRPYPDEAMEAMLLGNSDSDDLLEKAEGGDTDAMDLLAKQYLDDGEVEKASYWYLKLAEQGSAIGQFNIALFYLKGQGVEQDLEKALYWMKKAQESGDDDAPKFVDKFEEMIGDKKKADEGDLSAMTNLAAAYMTLGAGDSDDHDSPLYKECLRLAQKAADGNYPHAFWVLALAYEHGRGVDCDQEKYIEYYKKGAELGDAACQNSLGCVYLDGRGVLKNEKRAFNLFMQAAKQDYPLAMRSLGYCYQYGYGCEDSMAQCVYWLEKYLEYVDDPEIRQKAMVFKSLADDEELSGEVDESSLPDGYMDALASVMEEEELEDNEIIPDKIEFKGKNFVLTGFDTYAENDLTAEIESRGGRVRSSTVLDTDYLIYNERTGTDTKKYNRAKELNSQGKNIVIISRGSFVNFLEGEKPAAKSAKKPVKSSKPAEPVRILNVPKQAGITKTVTFGPFTINVPEGYFAEPNTKEDGKEELVFYTGKEVNDEGQVKYDFKVTITEENVVNSPFEEGYKGRQGFSLDGNIDNYIFTFSQEFNIMTLKIMGLSVVVLLRHDGHHYILKGAARMLRSDKPEDIDPVVDGFNTFFSSTLVDGKQIELEKFTADRLLNEASNDLNSDGESGNIPTAYPKSGQHTHLDYLKRMDMMSGMFGGMLQLNATGTECAFMPIPMLMEMSDSPSLDKIYKEISTGSNKSTLVRTAQYMAELFRVNRSVFDSGHDREQEILAGYVQRSSTYNMFRSFAWTFAAYCDKEGVKPEAVDIYTIYDIVDVIVGRDGLNYTADSYSPTICSGDDLHVYYVLDSVPKRTKTRLLSMVNKSSSDDDDKSTVMSLDSLREELDYMYPAIRAIYDELASKRDRDYPLDGPIADILYVWCSITYASREPFFLEDGPMNCGWLHPDQMRDKSKTSSKPYLKSVDRPAGMNKKEDLSGKFTYTQGIIAKGDGYTFEVPDGFVVKTDVEDRDFVAYLPDETDPDDYMISLFTIYAGQKLEGEVAEYIRLPAEYSGIMKGLKSSLVNLDVPQELAFNNVWEEEYERDDLPGAMLFDYDNGALHANALVGVDKHLQLMRVLVSNGVTRRNCEAYAELVRSMFDHMHADKPVKTLEKLDSPAFLAMGTDARSVKKWIECVDEYIEHLNRARNSSVNSMGEAYQAKADKGSISAEDVKRDLKEVLRGISKHAEKILVVAEAVYSFKRAQNPKGTGIVKMEEAVKKLIDTANSYLKLNDEKVSVKSPYAAIVKSRLKDDPFEVYDAILSEHKSELSADLKREFESLKTANERFEHIQKLKKLVHLLAEYKVFREEEADYVRLKNDLDPQIEDLTSMKNSLVSSVEEEASSFAAVSGEFDEELAKKQSELNQAQALFEIASQIAAALKKKADKGGFFYARNMAKYDAKQKEADDAREVMENKTGEYEQIKLQFETAEQDHADFVQESEKQIAEISGRLEALESELKSKLKDVSRAKKIYEQDKKVICEPEDEEDDDDSPASQPESKVEDKTHEIISGSSEDALLRQAILDNMEEGREYTINDLIREIPGLYTASTHHVAALLTPLKRDGLVIRKEINRKAFFSKAETVDMAEPVETRTRSASAFEDEVRRNQEMRQAILDNMVEGVGYTINDLIKVVPELRTASTHRVSALLTPLKRDGFVIRKEINGIAHFYKA